MSRSSWRPSAKGPFSFNSRNTANRKGAERIRNIDRANIAHHDTYMRVTGPHLQRLSSIGRQEPVFNNGDTSIFDADASFIQPNEISSVSRGDRSYGFYGSYLTGGMNKNGFYDQAPNEYFSRGKLYYKKGGRAYARKPLIYGARFFKSKRKRPYARSLPFFMRRFYK